MNGETNIADLVRQLRDDTISLVSAEVALAKSEVSEKLSRMGRNLGHLAVGALIASSSLMLVLMSLGYLLGELFVRRGYEPGVAAFLGFLLVGLAVGGVSATLVAKAIKSLRSDSIKPERTVRSLQEDKQWAQSKLSS
jgi:hypothetical protein